VSVFGLQTGGTNYDLLPYIGSLFRIAMPGWPLCGFAAQSLLIITHASNKRFFHSGKDGVSQQQSPNIRWDESPITYDSSQ